MLLVRMKYINEGRAEKRKEKETSSFLTCATQMSTKTKDVCQICGDRAKIVNYGALSCSACKTFFRRHGLYPEV